MSLKAAVRKYKMSDGDLLQLADAMNIVGTRDLASLEDYGVDTTTLTALMATRTQFFNTETDSELSGDMIIATQAKNRKKEELLKAIRQIADRARLKFGEQDGKFRKFGVEMLSRNKDSELVRVSKQVANAATEFLTDLESEGLTAEKITAFTTLYTEYDALLDAQHATIVERDYAVDVRIKLGNDLYAKIVNLAGKGKLCWQDTNEALYNDYILNPSSGGGKANVVTGTVAADATVNLSITGNDADTEFTLKNTGEANLVFYFANEPTDDSGPMSITVLPHTEKVTTATALGYNTAEGRIRFNAHNPGIAASGYEVLWE